MNDAGREVVTDFAEWGMTAFTTTRHFGSLSVATSEPVGEVMARWDALRAELARSGPRFATAYQVHGSDVIEHASNWTGWLRTGPADGHFSLERGTAMGVSVADCVPVFLAHPSGATSVLHSGWRGTAGRIVQRAVRFFFVEHGLSASDMRIHLGPSICGRCYEVSADVHAALTGVAVDRPTCVDLRELIDTHAREVGVREVSTSPWCTRCHNDRFFSHRAGDEGRQIGVLIAHQ